MAAFSLYQKTFYQFSTGIKSEKSNLPERVPDGNLIYCPLTFHNFTTDFCYEQKKLFKFKPETLVCVCFRLSEKDQIRFRCLPFLVFQLRVLAGWCKLLGMETTCLESGIAKSLSPLAASQPVGRPNAASRDPDNTGARKGTNPCCVSKLSGAMTAGISFFLIPPSTLQETEMRTSCNVLCLIT